MSDDSEEESQFEIEMPFTEVISKGGVYDDQSFVAGFQTGQIYYILQQSALVSTTLIVYRNLVKQIDLIAMKNGFRTVVTAEDEHWAQIEVTRIKNHPSLN